MVFVIIHPILQIPLKLDTPPPPPSGRGPFRGCWKNQDSRATLSLSRARKTPPESCLSLVYRGFLGVFRGGGGGYFKLELNFVKKREKKKK